MNGPFRIQPKMPVQAYKSYELRSPVTTHTRKATCQEVECRAYAFGWMTNVDVDTPLGARQANYIRLHSGRSFTVSEWGNLVSFTFPPGQQCFTEHRVPLEREPLYIVRGGDWRANTGLIRRHVRDGEWVEDFAEHQQSIVDAIEKG